MAGLPNRPSRALQARASSGARQPDLGIVLVGRFFMSLACQTGSRKSQAYSNPRGLRCKSLSQIGGRSRSAKCKACRTFRSAGFGVSQVRRTEAWRAGVARLAFSARSGWLVHLFAAVLHMMLFGRFCLHMLDGGGRCCCGRGGRGGRLRRRGGLSKSASSERTSNQDSE